MGQAQLFVGCRGWTEAQARYVRDFRTIEVQTTFYEPPSNAVAERWKAKAPPEFRFCMKAWQLITHAPSSPTYRRLKSAVSATERELYGSFRPTEQLWLAWQRTKTIAEIPRAEEPRGDAWNPSLVGDLCATQADSLRGSIFIGTCSATRMKI